MPKISKSSFGIVALLATILFLDLRNYFLSLYPNGTITFRADYIITAFLLMVFIIAALVILLLISPSDERESLYSSLSNYLVK